MLTHEGFLLVRILSEWKLQRFFFVSGIVLRLYWHCINDLMATKLIFLGNWRHGARTHFCAGKQMSFTKFVLFSLRFFLLYFYFFRFVKCTFFCERVKLKLFSFFPDFLKIPIFKGFKYLQTFFLFITGKWRNWKSQTSYDIFNRDS